MVEREIERRREPEPKFSHYEFQFKRHNDLARQHREGKRLVKWNDLPWEVARQGVLRYYSSPASQDVSAPGWTVFQQRITKPSGKHKHQGGLIIYAIDGEGYTVVDGVRYDWKPGDLLILPFKPGGVEHQHFDKDPNKPAHWLAIRYYPHIDAIAGEVTQIKTHEDWGKK